MRGLDPEIPQRKALSMGDEVILRRDFLKGAIIGPLAAVTPVPAPAQTNASAPTMPVARLSYDESCRRLQALGLLDDGEPPRMPDRMPRHDDAEPSGVSFFRTLVSEADLSNLTLPRTYFGRSKIERVSFQNADLTESNLSWNDLLHVDFSAAALIRSDLRRSLFDRVKFTGADMRGADLRGSSFKHCIFDHAIMDGAILARAQVSQISMSGVQKAAVDWRNNDGPEPGGG
jgi:hypothetical protein